MRETFEDFLAEKHGQQYVGTKDNMIDNFNDWIQDLDIDDWLKYGDEFQKKGVAQCQMTL